MAGADPTEGDARAARGDSASLSRLLIGGGLWSLLGRFGQSFVMLAGTVVLARVLTPGDFGVIAISTSLGVLMLVIAEGFIDFPILRSNALDENRLRSLLWTSFTIMGAISAAVIAAAPAVEALFGFTGLAGVLRASCVIFFCQAVMVTGRAVLRRQHRFRDAGLFMVVGATVYAVVAIALAFAGWGYWSLVAGQIALHVTMAAQFARAARLSLRWPRRFDLGGLAATGGYGLVSRVFAWFWSTIDTIAVGLAGTAAATGLYSRAYNLSTQAKEPFAALDHPIRQALVAKRERDGDIEAVARDILRLVTIGTGFAAAFVIVFRDLIVAVLLGQQWTGAALPLAILAAGLPARVGLNFIDSTIIVAGAMGHMVRRHLFMSVLIGAGVFWAAPRGIEAVALVVAAALYIAVLFPVAREDGHGAPPRLRLVAAMLPGLLFACALVAAGEALRRVWAPEGIAFAAAMLVIFGLAAALIALLAPEKWTFPAWNERKTALLSRLTGRSR